MDLQCRESHASLMKRTYYNRYLPWLGPLQNSPNFRLTTADGTTAPVTGQVTVPVSIYDHATGRNYTSCVTFLIVPTLSVDVLLGMDAIDQFFSSISVSDGALTFRNPHPVDPHPGSSVRSARVRATSRSLVDPLEHLQEVCRPPKPGGG